MKPIQTTQAPAAIGPYSQGIECKDFLFISGQLGLIPESGQLCEGVEAQTEQALRNLEAILAARHLATRSLLKVSIFVVDLSHFETINRIYASHLIEPYPAREVVQVAALPKGGLVEISAIAVIGE